MVQVSAHNIHLLNELTISSDKNRSKLTSTLLTIYAALSSGLFLFVSTQHQLVHDLRPLEKYSLLVSALSAVLIVALSASEKMLIYFASMQVGEQHAERIREQKTGNMNILKPKDFTSNALVKIPQLLVLLVVVNAISAGVYITARIV